MDTLRFVIYDKAGNFQAQIEGAAEASAELVANAVNTAEFTIPDDHRAVDAITTPGARCAVHFRGVERFRGMIKETPGEGPDGWITAQVRCDIRKFWEWYGWQVPGNAIGSQTSAYRAYTGPAETVAKNAMAENFTRLGVPWSVTGSAGRGATSRVQLRMHPLADKLFPILDANDLIVVLAYDGPNVVVGMRGRETVPGVLTLASGVPEGYEFNRIAPTATRVIVGGRGEGAAREFVQVIDSARESDWGDIVESFMDARNTEEGSDITIDGAMALAEGAEKAALSTELNETERFMFGTTYDVGDLVNVRMGPVEVTQPVSVSITESASNGVEVTPYIGDLDVSADTDIRMQRMIAKLAKNLRDKGRG
ncbi:Gp37-like protein [Microbacterium aurantiacum]|uniref:Gp37-like protein n=1 Tax=Microbacterium aurantiacum TaxID=162393 RepID=UPI0034384B79